jgi:hypothetical protein
MANTPAISILKGYIGKENLNRIYKKVLIIDTLYIRYDTDLEILVYPGWRYIQASES